MASPFKNLRIENTAVQNDDEVWFVIRVYVSGELWGASGQLYAVSHARSHEEIELRCLECTADLIASKFGMERWRDIWYAHQHAIQRQVRQALRSPAS